MTPEQERDLRYHLWLQEVLSADAELQENENGSES